LVFCAGVVIEEVPDFATHRDPKTGHTYLELLLGVLKMHHYSHMVLELCHSQFCELPRQRMFVVGLHEDYGSSQALTWMQELIVEVFQHQSLKPVVRALDIVDTNGREESKRRLRQKADILV